MIRSILTIFMIFGILSPRSVISFENNIRQSDNVIELRLYIQNLVDHGYDLLNNEKFSEPKKRAKISKLIAENLYLDWMARYTLGRHRRVLSEREVEEFIVIYSKFVIKAYTDLFEYYNGHKALIKIIQEIDEDSFIVQMEILKPSAQSSIEVSYLVHKIDREGQNTNYKIADIITEGISILNSQQSEFNSVISSQGLESLVEDLKNKINQDINAKKTK